MGKAYWQRHIVSTQKKTIKILQTIQQKKTGVIMPVDLQTLVIIVLRTLKPYLEEDQEVKFSVPLDGTNACMVSQTNTGLTIDFKVKLRSLSKILLDQNL